MYRKNKKKEKKQYKKILYGIEKKKENKKQ